MLVDDCHDAEPAAQCSEELGIEDLSSEVSVASHFVDLQRGDE
jgi:hypothetical protein